MIRVLDQPAKTITRDSHPGARAPSQPAGFALFEPCFRCRFPTRGDDQRNPCAGSLRGAQKSPVSPYNQGFSGILAAYKLIWTNNLGEKETRWVNPAEGLATIKRHVERVASHPQGVGVLDAELLSRVLAPR